MLSAATRAPLRPHWLQIASVSLILSTTLFSLRLAKASPSADLWRLSEITTATWLKMPRVLALNKLSKRHLNHIKQPCRSISPLAIQSNSASHSTSQSFTTRQRRTPRRLSTSLTRPCRMPLTRLTSSRRTTSVMPRVSSSSSKRTSLFGKKRKRATTLSMTCEVDLSLTADPKRRLRAQNE